MDAVVFVLLSFLLGVGLAVDAFSVSVANGLAMPSMSRTSRMVMAGVFAGFQGLMPMIGWLCVHLIVERFTAFEAYIPWLALVLLLIIGIKMLIEGIRGSGDEAEPVKAAGPGAGMLLFQGVATSIDALSVGFTIADYGWLRALLCAGIIAAVTFGLCAAGGSVGKRLGERFTGKARIIGGVILIAIGLEIWIKGVFF